MRSEMFALLRQHAFAGLCMPGGRFFKPTPRFFEVLRTFKDISWIDAGTGSGELPHEARAEGFKMVGIDMADREGQMPDVLRADAARFPYDENLWPVLCRPSHDGWVYDTICHALKRGAGALYVGLLRNVDQDLEDFADLATLQVWPGVGEEGESLYLIPPGSCPAESQG